jgi:HK97 family phage portal protein
VFKDYGKAGGRTIRELWGFPCHRIRPIPGPNRTVGGYEYLNDSGENTPIPAENILAFRRYNPEHGLLGLSPLQAAFTRLLTERDAQRWIRVFYRQGGSVAGFFSGDQTIPPQEREAIEAKMMRRLSGPENAGRPVILPTGLRFERSALTMSEMQFIEVSKMTKLDVMNCYHIPPVLLGMKEGGGLSDAGATTDLALFYEHCIIPRCELIQSVINEQMLEGGDFGSDLTCEFDLSGVLVLQ